MNEITCQYSWWGGGIINCKEPATYTLRYDDRVYHFCKEHYQEVKEDILDSEND
jgi:hypothetical protein